MRRLWQTLGILAALGLVVLGGGILYIDRAFQRLEAEPMVGAGEGRTVTITSGSTFTGVARRLAEEGLIDEPLTLRLYARYHGLATRVQAGEYAVDPSTTAVELIEAMVDGRVVQHGLTVVEGWSFRELRQAVERHPVLEQTADELNDAELMAELGHPDEHPEGRFLPETYRFPRGTTDMKFYAWAYASMEKALAAEWERRADGLPYDSPYEALIMASIVEKETGVPEERPRIAGVFVRRLQRGMRLQTDPTVIYGIGEDFDGDIRYRDLRRDTPYNTYTRHGLPPTPIALPGREALHAALNPADGSSLYFVSRGDGSHVFSDTLEEHNRAVREYQLGKSE